MTFAVRDFVRRARTKILQVVIGALGLMALLFVIYLGVLFVAHGFDPRFLSIDACLDRGGCWDRIAKTCRGNEPNAQALCNRDEH